MVAERQIVGAGTSEESWAQCEGLKGVPFVSGHDLIPVGARVVVCAPHPDDEILPCGGLLASLADHPVCVVALTDGEASDRSQSEYLRKVRPRETDEALRRLGVAADVTRLGFPDGGLEELESELVAALTEIFCCGDVVMVPWLFDGHPDHEAAFRAVRRAADLKGGVNVIQMPIWGWHWALPDQEAMPWARAVRIAMSDEVLTRKRNAIASFTSQLESRGDCGPILSATTLRRFQRPWETFFR